MTLATNDDAAIRELSIDEVEAVAGGFWKELGAAITAGAVTGGMGGSIAPGVGTTAGAVGGGLLAGIGYCITQLF